MSRPESRRQSKGNSVVEMAFMVPWIIFLFVGVFDFGFYAYALMSVQSATRVAALNASSDMSLRADQQAACDVVRLELTHMPNSASFSAACDAAPLVVTATAVNGIDSIGGQPPVPATRVSVTYNTITMIPIPGLLSGTMQFRRTVEMRVQ